MHISPWRHDDVRVCRHTWMDCMICWADCFVDDFKDAATKARYWMTFLVFSVLPAPDSPLNKHNTAVRRHATTIQHGHTLHRQLTAYKDRVGTNSTKPVFVKLCFVKIFADGQVEAYSRAENRLVFTIYKEQYRHKVIHKEATVLKTLQVKLATFSFSNFTLIYV